jgi:hypothetical protein
MEAETVQGKPLNAIAYGTLTGHLTRTLNALGLGLKREPIDVTPVLNEYLSTLPAETQDLVAARTRVRVERLHAFSAEHQGFNPWRTSPVSAAATTDA